MSRAACALTVLLCVPGVGWAGQAPAPPPARQAAPLTTEQLGQVYDLYLKGLDQMERRDAGGPSAAIALYRKALEVAPAAADLRAALATLLAQNQQLAEARVEAQRAIDDDADNREAHRVLGLIESAMIQQAPKSATPEMLQEAIGHLEYAVAGDVHDLPAELTLAELYLQHGNAARAVEAARRFLEDRPGFPRAVIVLVAALDASGRSDEVPAALAELREEPAEELLALAQAFGEDGAVGHIVSLLEPRVKDPQPEDLQNGAYGRLAASLGMALVEQGESKRAVAIMEEARARQGGEAGPVLLFYLAAAYERDGQSAAAERTFRTLLAENPAHARSLNYLGYLLAERGEKLDEAVDLINRALALEPDNPNYLDSLGWAYYRQGRFDQALPPLERAARALPQTSVVQDHLGDVYLGMKRYQDAAAAFGRALDGDREDVDVAAITEKRERARKLAAQ